MIATTLRALVFALFLAVSQAALAQNPPAQSDAGSQLLSAGQLDALVSHIALHPDPLLSEVMMASTYPLEVVEAERSAHANKNLTGDALKAAVDKQSWDDSVKSLTDTPSVLDMMSQQLDWTQQLGNAALAQQSDVMAAVQRLRAKAQANQKLASNPRSVNINNINRGNNNWVHNPAHRQGVRYSNYYYKILSMRRPGAPGGAPNYVVNGKMIGGFAHVAYPADYRNSGVMTFIVSQEGKVFQKDLGPETATAAEAITAYNPDRGWKKADATEAAK